MNDKFGYSNDDRILNLEAIIIFVTLNLAIYNILRSNPGYHMGIKLSLLTIFLIILCVILTRIQIASLFVLDHYDKKSRKIYNLLLKVLKRYKKQIIFSVNWIVIISLIIIAKNLMQYGWGQAIGVLLFSIIGNFVLTKWSA